ncbi:patatin-like phospholipase family protein [Phormidium tenue FACHB-886]|nr:patatin-like phospholipase family protein [Phormidium tenue FACHB-886]
MSQASDSSNHTFPSPITLNCSGGISLGAYMAGVFYELIREATQDNPSIYIDIITGASAGAMTGAIAAYYLLNDQAKELLKESNIPQNGLYRAWVEKADIRKIDYLGFRPQIDGKTGCRNWSVLSGAYLKELAEEVIGPGEIEITAQTRPLALLMTLTNLSGLLKDTNNSQNKFKSITNAETRLFLFHKGLAGNRPKVEKMWEKVLLGGRASGAFPVAFPPVGDDSSPDSYNLLNCAADYQPPNKPELSNVCVPDSNGTYKFLYSYTDGGVLDGLPINKGIAFFKQLIAKNPFGDQESQGFSEKYKQQFLEFQAQWRESYSIEASMKSGNRKYVYIQPSPVQDLNSNPDLTTRCFSMLKVGLKGLTLPKAEHDALRLQNIEDFNKVVKKREELVEALQREKPLPEGIQEILDQAIPFIPVHLNRIDPTIIEKLANHSNSQLQQLYNALILRNPKIQEKLENRDSNGLLASDFFGAFGGFFDRRYREHDFTLGRLCGLAWLHQNCPTINTSVPSDLLDQIQAKILVEEPELTPSGWLRVVRMALRTLRILLIEAKNRKIFWNIVMTALRYPLIAGLAILELLLSILISSTAWVEKMLS